MRKEEEKRLFEGLKIEANLKFSENADSRKTLIKFLLDRKKDSL